MTDVGRPPPPRPVDVNAELLEAAKRLGVDPNILRKRYALERFVYRLSISPTRDPSPTRDLWVLKGALCLSAWTGHRARPTSDIDLLAVRRLELAEVREVMGELCGLSVAEDGASFDAGSLRVTPIRHGSNDGGASTTILGRVSGVPVKVQVDIGFGDVVTPGSVELDLPRILLRMPAARLPMYPRETIVAEKLEALVSLGVTNSRLKDFFDLWQLSQGERGFAAADLMRAVAATFRQRGTPIPENLPPSLASEWAVANAKQWETVASRLGRDTEIADFPAVLDELRRFVWPLLQAVGEIGEVGSRWKPSIGWGPAGDTQ